MTQEIRFAVREALDNSLVNGYDPRNARDAEFLAEDLRELDADMAEFSNEDIIPYVKEWLKDNG